MPPRPTSSPRRSPPLPLDVAGKHVYLIGIGGSGMSGLARMLKSRAAFVQGSDQEPSDATRDLDHDAMPVSFDQATGTLPARCDLVIASAAIKPSHPQMAEANRRAIPTLMYAEALGRCMQGRTGACVAGTHGKSTTTAMLGTTLVDCGLDPTVIVGATSSQLQFGALQTEKWKVKAENAGGSTKSVGFRLGRETIPAGPLANSPGIIVAESCEFDRSFHNYFPTVACISSVEADHLDCYGTLDAVVDSFHEFATHLPPAKQGGKLLIAHDGAHRREVTAGVECEVHTIGYSPESDWRVRYEPATRGVELVHRQRMVAAWTMTLAGAHNAINAATALVLAHWLGADLAKASESLSKFRGIDRRMQLLGEKPVKGGVVRVFDDYGHHPTEVDVTLRAFRESERPELRNARLICVFQPHQHSRTRHLLDEFAASFSQADVVIIPEIYFVRDSEEERQRVSSKDLVDRLREKGVNAMHLDPFAKIVEQLQDMCRAGDVVVSMGAGPVWKVARGYLDAK